MQNQGIGTWVTRRAQRMCEDVALVFRDQRIGYDALAERIHRLSNALADRGVRAGDRVAYLGNNHPSFLEALFASTALNFLLQNLSR